MLNYIIKRFLLSSFLSLVFLIAQNKIECFKNVLTLCRRQREKHRAHLTEIRNLRDCTVNASGLMSKSSPRLESTLQLQKVTSCGCR